MLNSFDVKSKKIQVKWWQENVEISYDQVHTWNNVINSNDVKSVGIFNDRSTYEYNLNIYEIHCPQMKFSDKKKFNSLLPKRTRFNSERENWDFHYALQYWLKQKCSIDRAKCISTQPNNINRLQT